MLWTSSTVLQSLATSRANRSLTSCINDQLLIGSFNHLHKTSYVLFIFDLDDTLLDTLSGITEALNFTLKRFKHPPVARDYVSTIVNDGELLFMEEALQVEDPVLVARASEIFRERYLSDCYAEPFVGVPELLTALVAARKKIAVVSNKPHPIAEKQLRLANLVSYIDVFKSDDGSMRLKPCPDAIEQVLRETGAAAPGSLMIGDSCVDIKAGQAAHVLTCSVTYGYTDRNVLSQAGPDFLVDDIRDLGRML
ncbi:HAD family hydrolase [Acididesulfobacillus acetoxydans]|uniref:HAD family hydrolase n=1 Tax=Acididesulfobacillus acetoxydans TaxID=1561005 RepID=UPI001F0E8FBC|nr:HAD-IA family hydrolase [Acididesulfobacillus acetoxydans]